MSQPSCQFIILLTKQLPPGALVFPLEVWIYSPSPRPILVTTGDIEVPPMEYIVNNLTVENYTMKFHHPPPKTPKKSRLRRERSAGACGEPSRLESLGGKSRTPEIGGGKI